MLGAFFYLGYSRRFSFYITFYLPSLLSHQTLSSSPSSSHFLLLPWPAEFPKCLPVSCQNHLIATGTILNRVDFSSWYACFYKALQFLLHFLWFYYRDKQFLVSQFSVSCLSLEMDCQECSAIFFIIPVSGFNKCGSQDVICIFVLWSSQDVRDETGIFRMLLCVKDGVYVFVNFIWKWMQIIFHAKSAMIVGIICPHGQRIQTFGKWTDFSGITGTLSVFSDFSFSAHLFFEENPHGILSLLVFFPLWIDETACL